MCVTKDLQLLFSKFRKAFNVKKDLSLNWFPGHMGESMKVMQSRLKQVDCLIEIHDARIPLSGRNINFKNSMIGIKPHLLVLNKMDLSDLKHQTQVLKKLNENGVNEVLYTNAKDQQCQGIKSIIPTALKLIDNSIRYNRELSEERVIMIIGVPNVGKSSVINQIRNVHLRKGKASKVGAIAGITRKVQEKIRVCNDPLTYLLDTPGIGIPNFKDKISMMKLAACGTVKDSVVGEEYIADYILFFLNSTKNFRYVEELQLSEPCDDIESVLTSVAKLNDFQIKRTNIVTRQLVSGFDLHRAAIKFVTLFRKGAFGEMFLDHQYISQN